MSQELKPCPICGNKPFVFTDRDEQDSINCGSCDLSMDVSETIHGTAKWNRRTPGPATKAMLDRIKEDRLLGVIPDGCSVDIQVTMEELRFFIAEWEDK